MRKATGINIAAAAAAALMLTGCGGGGEAPQAPEAVQVTADDLTVTAPAEHDIAIGEPVDIDGTTVTVNSITADRDCYEGGDASPYYGADYEYHDPDPHESQNGEYILVDVTIDVGNTIPSPYFLSTKNWHAQVGRGAVPKITTKYDCGYSEDGHTTFDLTPGLVYDLQIMFDVPAEADVLTLTPLNALDTPNGVYRWKIPQG